ncbi:triggering receptor expressed on myeloid cells 2-like isoform X2 [Sceloporus undulatus]|uniref:triggering receptor expressed on myeloid cells 2-like isoform X2 n=1 Tax=Sceloporus undulatus TaxID=8520 RepID=UPI001C4C512D|nr:triggering receptor expressed on myeloid cells 2-like isoform X2 [Sceloporus undulatus]
MFSLLIDQREMEMFVYLVCLVSLSDAHTTEDVAVVYGVEGKSISINCSYSPKENQWRKKSWCKHISERECQHIVSARTFWMPFLKRRNGTTAIADNIDEGILTVTINPLQKHDAGLYQCKTDFLGVVNTLLKVKVNVLTGLRETETPEEPRAAHSISSTLSDPEVKLHMFVAGFLGIKLLVAVLILIIARSLKNRTTGDRNRRGNEHQLLPVTGNGWHS